MDINTCLRCLIRGVASFIPILLIPVAFAQAMGGKPDRPVEAPETKAPVTVAVETEKPLFAVTGRVTRREEIWDRRTNPLMGRPDILVEILLDIKVELVIGGKAPAEGDEIRVSIRGERSVIAHKRIQASTRGAFTLSGFGEPYELITFEPEGLGDPTDNPPPPPVRPPKPKPTPIATGAKDSFPELERLGARAIVKSPELREKAVRVIAGKYGMTEASFITMKSFSGPTPPDEGYLYWGVKGKIRGKWHTWQPRYGLREEDGLEDPQRYNKCLSPGTMIATPAGPVPVEEIKVGDLVYSGSAAVPVIRVAEVRARNHKVSRIRFDDGSILEISPGHPLPDGTLIGGLKPGGKIGGKAITDNELIPYRHEYTYDILPDSPSGEYRANGIALASTLSD